MKFQMNNYNWLIKLASSDEVKEAFNNKDEDSYYYGVTTFSKQEILINKNATEEKQKETLYHELMHAYLYCYIGDNLTKFNEEDLCCISAKSHRIIHKIAKDFFQKLGGKK